MTRVVRAPRGTELSCKGWQQEAALRMLMNNLDPEVAERPEDLVVYGGRGKAARNWEAFDAIVKALRSLENDETLLVQSGKPVAVFRTHPLSPRVLIANSNLVPHWGTWEHFWELEKKGLMMYGQMTAGSWIYIGSQGIVQGTYETFVEMGRQHHGGDLSGKWILTAGLGGMGGAQPLAATMAGASMLAIECRQSRIDMRLRTRYVDEQADDLDDAWLVHTATGDPCVDRAVAAWAEERRIWCIVASDVAEGSARLPAQEHAAGLDQFAPVGCRPAVRQPGRDLLEGEPGLEPHGRGGERVVDRVAAQGRSGHGLAQPALDPENEAHPGPAGRLDRLGGHVSRGIEPVRPRPGDRPGGHPGDNFLHQLAHELEHDFGIGHATVQVETIDGHECALLHDHVI